MRIYVLALSVALVAPSLVQATPALVRLSYASANTGTEMAITWTTEAAETNYVQYGPTTSFGFEAASTSFKGSADVFGYIHEAQLTDLQPNTLYYYRVGSDLDGWSGYFTFRTGQPQDETYTDLTFVVLGDSRSESDRGPSPIFHDILQEAINNEEPAFLLHGGDIVHEGTIPHEWMNQLIDIQDISPFYPIMYTIGNHDDGPEDGPGAYYNQVFQLPTNPESKGGEFSAYSDLEDFYYFTYGDAIFVSLSTQTYKDFDMQARWLDQVLTENPRTWKFVYFHHPIYTSNPLGLFHEPNENGQNPYLVPIFDKHHVDIVFTSHNHFYERFAPSYGGYGTSAEPVDDFSEGTVYVVTGGGGASTAPFSMCNAEGSQMCSGRNHYIVITISGNELDYEVKTTDAQLYGLPRGHLADRFQIVKEGANP